MYTPQIRPSISLSINFSWVVKYVYYQQQHFVYVYISWFVVREGEERGGICGYLDLIEIRDYSNIINQATKSF